MPKELENHPKIHHSTRPGTSTAGVALKVGDIAGSHLIPLHVPNYTKRKTSTGCSLNIAFSP